MDFDPNKYALVKMQIIKGITDPVIKKQVEEALVVLQDNGVLVQSTPGSEHEFFLIMLKDLYAPMALTSYAVSVREHSEEVSDAVFERASRSGPSSPYCKLPD